MNNILIHLRAFQKTLYMAFHVFQGKSRMTKNKMPTLFFIFWFWEGEDVSHSIHDHMLTALILVGLDGYFWIFFPRNPIKLDRACILRAYLLCLSHILEILLSELTIVNRSFPVIEVFIVLIP